MFQSCAEKLPKLEPVSGLTGICVHPFLPYFLHFSNHPFLFSKKFNRTIPGYALSIIILKELPVFFLSGHIVAICMSHANASEDLLRSWITNLQSENPQLANISVIFNLNQTPR